jgi:2-oxoglutarate dehydrogenase E2 component (dihydrolipoamide succinyltransferase)
MIKDVLLPEMGESITDATVIQWHVSVGDQVSEDDTLLEVATDKVDSEIPSPVSGIVKEILAQKDDVINVGSVIVKIAVEGSEDAQAGQPALKSASQAKEGQAAQKTTAASTISVSPLQSVEKETMIADVTPAVDMSSYSPLVKSMISKHAISETDLSKIAGSGKDGRLIKRDVEAYIKQREVIPLGNPEKKMDKTTVARSPEIDLPTVGSDQLVAMSRMRKMIAKHMTQSLEVSAHVTSFAEADVTELVSWIGHIKESFLKKHGTKLTFTTLFIDILTKALSEFPKINASIVGDNIQIKKDINIGVATALPDGNLIVPVLHQVNNYSITGIASKLNDIVARARKGALSPDEVQKGTFTLTNIGTFNSLMATPIINQPQLAILATGAIKKRPTVVETKSGDAIMIRKIMYLSLSYDHRVIDGYLGGTFLNRIVELLENYDSSSAL